MGRSEAGLVIQKSIVAPLEGNGDLNMEALTPAEHSVFAEQLWDAAADRRPIHPLSDLHPDLMLADGYAVQRQLVRRHIEHGARIVGAKLGFTSHAMRHSLGVSDPNYGWLLNRMILDGPSLFLSDWIHPRVEPEIGFRLAHSLRGPGVGSDDVLNATASVFPCLEIVDSRFHDYRFRAADNTADNSSAAGLRIGADVDHRQIDLRLVGVVFEEDGDVIATSAGAAALGHPAGAVAWLANRLADTERALETDDIVISGGLTQAFPLKAGRRINAHFDRLGSVSCDVRYQG